MREIKRLIQEIDRGVALRKNLPAYREMLADTYVNYAAVELTFSAYLLWETATETADEREEAWQACYEEVMRLLAETADAVDGAGEQIPSLVARAGRIREEITTQMDVYTSYTDRLINYSYVLGRLPVRFAKEQDFLEHVKSLDEEELLRRLLGFVHGQGDAGVQKERLQVLAGLLPVQMTKNKWLEKIERTLTLYKGGDRASLDTFVYMIRSAAMLHQPQQDTKSASRMGTCVRRLQQTDFDSLNEADYDRLQEELDAVSKEVLEITDLYYSLQKVVNGIYAVLLAVRHGEGASGIGTKCTKIWRETAGGTCREESLIPLEGRIEAYVERSSYLEAVLFEIRSSYREILDELGLTHAFEDFAAIANLLSDSLFIDLEQTKEEGVLEDGEWRRISDGLLEELSECLSSLSKPVKRAVMAAVLEKLPSEFQSADEIAAYIRTNLFGCRNLAEKAAVLVELGEWMEDEVPV